MQITLAIIFLGLIFIYAWWQFLSTLFEKHFIVTISLLVGQSISGFLLASSVLSQQIQLPVTIVIVLIALWSTFAFIIAISKLLFLDDLRLKPPKHVTRERVQVGLPHDIFYTETVDGVRIKGFHIRSDNSKLIILCHGGGRCKNSFAILSLAQWLSYDYDVIGFDTRGHFESGGYWTGDGKTKLDLLSVLDYAADFHYDKIGIVGRSLGGWTAALVAGKREEVNSLVLIAAPLTHIRNLPLVRQLEPLKYWPGRLLVRALHGLRFQDYDDTQAETPSEVLEKLTIPTLFIYSKNDEVVGLTEKDVEGIFRKIPAYKKLHIFPETVHLPKPHHLGPIFLLAKDWFADTLEA